MAVASRRSIQHIQKQADSFDVDRGVGLITEWLTNLPRLPPGVTPLSSASADAMALLAYQSLSPLMVAAFDTQISRWHRIPIPFAVMWAKVARPLLQVYRKAVEEASRTSAHAQVYEASVTLLNRYYLAQVQKHHDAPPNGIDPRIYALEMAKKHCGFREAPKSDLRFRVEALWATISVRDVLISLAKGVEDNLRGLAVVTDELRVVWSDFVGFILRSTERDAKVSIRIAESNESHRQAARATLLLLGAEFNSFIYRASRLPRGTDPSKILETLVLEAGKLKEKSMKEQLNRAVVYRDAMQACPGDEMWIEDDFVTPARAIIDKWTALMLKLDSGFFTDVSDSERREVVRALMTAMGGGWPSEHSFQEPDTIRV
jgi:hypothetical protein